MSNHTPRRPCGQELGRFGGRQDLERLLGKDGFFFGFVFGLFFGFGFFGRFFGGRGFVVLRVAGWIADVL